MTDIKIKLPKDHNAPKRSLSAYFLFLEKYRDHYNNYKGKHRLRDISCALVEKWRSLTSEERKSFEDEATILKQKYILAKDKYDRIKGLI